MTRPPLTPEEEFARNPYSGMPGTLESSDGWPAWKVWANNVVGVVFWLVLLGVPIGIALWINSFPWTHFLPWP